MAGIKILVIDSDETSRNALCQKLSQDGYEVIPAPSGTKAIHTMLEQPPALVIVDSALVEEDPFASAWDAFGIMHWIKHMLPQHRIPMIIHTFDLTGSLRDRAAENGFFAVVKKDHTMDELLLTVRKAVIEYQAAA